MPKPPIKFATGDDVEVIRRDSETESSLYEARIVRSMPRLKRYVVEYLTLMNDSNPPKNLQDTVETSNLRPRPQPPAKFSFEIGEKIDSFHENGWWVGEVSKIMDGGKRIAVRFVGGDEEEFDLDRVRVHMDWIDGEWIFSQVSMQSLLRMEFRKGIQVEVSSDDEGFRGAWYTATMLEYTGKNFLVEYHNLRTEDETEPLKETVDFLHIRPIPPDVPVVDNFKFLEEVDAFYNDGWWVGVISKVVMGPRYLVFFKPWNEEIEFGHSDLRLHHEWIGGQWQRASRALDL